MNKQNPGEAGKSQDERLTEITARLYAAIEEGHDYLDVYVDVKFLLWLVKRQSLALDVAKEYIERHDCFCSVRKEQCFKCRARSEISRILSEKT